MYHDGEAEGDQHVEGEILLVARTLLTDSDLPSDTCDCTNVEMAEPERPSQRKELAKNSPPAMT